MQTPATPVNEADRLQDLKGLNILDTMAEERFDRFTRLAQRMFEVPIALVSLVDTNRQWFKSRQGLDACETGRDISFCGHTVLSDQPLIIEDARQDERFRDNPLVTGEPGIRFYAGCPVYGPRGQRVGTFCIIDRKPRQFPEEDVQALADMAALVSSELSTLQLAMTDELTGLSNRRGFDMLIDHAMAMCERSGQGASIVAVDLNGFKQINDSHGHAEGDRALQDFARILQATFRESDVLARVGGDEFCVLLTGTDQAQAQVAIERLTQAIAEHNAQSGKSYRLYFSAGVACAVPGRAMTDVVAQADQNMYAVKQREKAAADTRVI